MEFKEIFFRKLSFPVWLVAVISLVMLGVLALSCLLPREATVQEMPEPLHIPEGKTAIAVQGSAILAEQLGAGDVVRLYNAAGQVIPQLQYVEVLAASTSGELLLLMNDIQVSAFISQYGGAVSLIEQDAIAAATMLELQKKIMNPQIHMAMPTQKILAPGETAEIELTITVDPDAAILPEIVWSSSEASVATVESGRVTAHQTGKTVVTASCGAVTVQCEVVVRVELKEIVLNYSDHQLGVGKSLPLTATPTPADASDFSVIWQVNDPAVASVAEDGTVTALSPGTVIVTAMCGDVSASCRLNIAVLAEMIQLEQSSLNLKVKETATLSYHVYPANSVLGSPVYTSSNEKVVTVSQDGVITAIGTGKATVTVTCGNISDSCVIEVTK